MNNLTPYPPQQPMKQCGGCQSMNEPYRTTCRNCQQPLSD